MSKFMVTLQGTQPFIMHNVQLANPFNEYTRKLKAISSKRQKTDDDLMAMAEIEFQGGLYYHDELGPVVPSKLLFAVIHAGAKQDKRGQHVIRSGLTFSATDHRLAYDGPRDREGLWGGGSSPFVYVDAVGVNNAKIMRTRPRFAEWSVEFYAELDTTQLGAEEFATAVDKGGRLIGIGDFRKLNGRFTSTVTEL